MANFKEAHKWMTCCGADGYYNADFNQAQELVRKAEGGYSNDPRDKGGETYKGISRVFNPNWSGWVIIDAYKKTHTLKTNAYIPDKKLDELTESYYKSEYWNKIKGDEINNQRLANMIYDMSVNPIKPGAKQIVIDSLKVVSKDDTIKNYDVKKINVADPNKLFNEIGKRRSDGYKERGGYALNSWLNRLKSLGYGDVLETVKRNKGKTAMIALGLGIAISGIYLYNKNK